MEAPNVLRGKIVEEKPKVFINLELKTDKNILFDITIYYLSDKLYFKGESKDKFPQKKYKKEYTLEEIKENKFFYLYENIMEIYDEVDSLINNIKDKNELKLLEETNKIIISIPLPSVKIKECLFEMNEIEVSAEQKFGEVFDKLNETQISISENYKTLKEQNSEIKKKCQEIEQLNNEIKEQNNNLKKNIEELKHQNIELNQKISESNKQNNELKQLNNELNQQNIEIKNQINEIKVLCDELKQQNNQIKEEIINELKDYHTKKTKIALEKIDNINEIINNMDREKKKIILKKEEQRKNDLNLISKWIDPYQKIEFKLIFKKSLHGDTTNDFHYYCDNKGKTVTIIETKDGYRFGGFKNDSWDKNGWKKNTKDFVFSLNRKFKYSHCGEGDTTYGNIDYGPNFGNSSNPGEITFYKTLNYGRNVNDKYKTNGELNMHKDYFETVELDVYKVIY